MKKIAIFVSGAGEAAERIVKLFNEGNRLRTDYVFVDDSAENLVEILRSRDVKVVHIPDAEWLSKAVEVGDMLRNDGIDLIVLDGFSQVIPDEVMEAVNGELIRVSSSELAPREVVAALEKDLRKPETESVEETAEPDKDPSLESEWAETLKINYTPPKIPTDPPSYTPNNQTPDPQIPNPQIPDTPYPNNPYPNTQYPNSQYSNHPHNQDQPMPSTWLIWSILVTIFCCFIPGIIAIIFSSQVSSRYYAGDIEGARRSSRLAEIWIIVSVVLGVIGATLYIPFMLISN